MAKSTQRWTERADGRIIICNLKGLKDYLVTHNMGMLEMLDI